MQVNRSTIFKDGKTEIIVCCTLCINVLVECFLTLNNSYKTLCEFVFIFKSTFIFCSNT